MSIVSNIKNVPVFIKTEINNGTLKTNNGMPQKDNLTGVKTVLNKILTFLNKSFDREVQLREKENNFKESYKLQDDKRHNQLLKVLAGISASGGETDAIVWSRKYCYKTTVCNKFVAVFHNLMCSANEI